MQKPSLFVLLPEDLVCTPDSMEIDQNGDLILACPNFADLSMKSCICKISKKDRSVTKWFDMPLNPESGEARAMGLAFGPDGDLYIVDNQGWTGKENMMFRGRIIRVRVENDKVTRVTTVANGMEHPNGVRIKDGYIYVTQSKMSKVKTESGKLLSCVYRFPLDAENIQVTNTLEDKDIITTYITQNPECQYGVDGIVFNNDGDLLIGNFGDGEIYKVKFNEDGSVKENKPWAKNWEEMKSTDGMICDHKTGNVYVADFNANAICLVTPEGKVSRYAQSPDCDGFDGGLDQPGEPIIWEGSIIASCFDLETDATKVNTAHEMPATMSMLSLE